MCVLSELLKNWPKNGMVNRLVINPDNGAADIINLKMATSDAIIQYTNTQVRNNLNVKILTYTFFRGVGSLFYNLDPLGTQVVTNQCRFPSDSAER